MDFASVVDVNLTYESGPGGYDDFPQTGEPVSILGEQYSALYDLPEIRDDIKSRCWFTYRKGFPSIGGTGPTSDTGWGCMLRCGQMMLAQALMLRHLGRGWRWNQHQQDKKYRRILEMFQDKKSAYFSIHQIASMGVSEGKSVGQWFGPNTVAQVIKKLAVYDDWSSLMIHVAMDNSVIEDDIRCLCRCKHKGGSENCDMRESLKSLAAEGRGADFIDYPSSSSSSCTQDSETSGSSQWRPLLLVIPLRLGLTDTNVVYVESLKKCLSFKQSIGMIGGKPNHAYWFIGFVGEELVYLDPHTTQMNVDLEVPGSSDESFHCEHASRMKVLDLDPSVALGFYCGTEEEFDDLCSQFHKYITCRKTSAMFELHKERPHHWPPYEPYSVGVTVNTKDFDVVDQQGCDSEEEFELVG